MVLGVLPLGKENRSFNRLFEPVDGASQARYSVDMLLCSHIVTAYHQAYRRGHHEDPTWCDQTDVCNGNTGIWSMYV